MNNPDKTGFAIGTYHDTNKIYSQIDQLIGQDIRPIHRPEMEKYLAAFEQKYASSKPVIDQAKKFIPGGVQHNLAFNYPFPIVFDLPDICRYILEGVSTYVSHKRFKIALLPISLFC